jgi:hypothetical protein
MALHPARVRRAPRRRRLGEVGGRITGEVLLEIIAHDPGSYLAIDSGREPTLPAHDGTFRLRDLLVAA